MRKRTRSVAAQFVGPPDRDACRSAWIISAKHLLRGQKYPAAMIAEAVLAERRRCLAIASECYGSDSDIARRIRDGEAEE